MAIFKALWSHPLNWKPDSLLTATLPIVIAKKNILRETKVSDLDHEVSINPEAMYNRVADKLNSQINMLALLLQRVIQSE